MLHWKKGFLNIVNKIFSLGSQKWHTLYEDIILIIEYMYATFYIVFVVQVFKIHVQVEAEEEMELKGTSKRDKSDDDIEECRLVQYFRLSVPYFKKDEPPMMLQY